MISDMQAAIMSECRLPDQDLEIALLILQVVPLRPSQACADAHDSEYVLVTSAATLAENRLLACLMLLKTFGINHMIELAALQYCT